MYAIVEIAGQQFKVELGKKIFVHRQDSEEGNELTFDQVLLIEDDGKIEVGEPVVKNAVVKGVVVDHVRGDKVIVFKKKRKKGYRVKNGHRQNFTQVEIVSINGKSVPASTTAKKAAKPEAEAKPKKAAKATEPKGEETVKKAAAKKTTEKATAAKKPAAKKSSKSKE